MGELLSCPFCGGAPHLTEHEGHVHSDLLVRLTGLPKQMGSTWTIECQRCPCGIIDDDRSAVVAAWNRRAIPSTVSGETKSSGRKAIRLLARMVFEGTLSEGQVCNQIDIDRYAFRGVMAEVEDELFNKPLTYSETPLGFNPHSGAESGSWEDDE